MASAPLEDHTQRTNDLIRKGSDDLAKALGAMWPCGHYRKPETTHRFGKAVCCKVCRRSRIRRVVRAIAVNQAYQRRVREASQYVLSEARAEGKELTKAQRDLQVERVLAGNSSGKLPLDVLKKGLANYFQQPVRTFTSHSRVRSCIHMRAVLIRILRERGLSYPTIGRIMGGRDHSSVINSFKNFDIYERQNSRVTDAYRLFCDKGAEI